MPELPEVEVTRRKLAPALLGRTVAQVHVGAPSYFFLTPPGRLKARLQGERLLQLQRHGKYLLLRLSSGASLLLHLGMTGQLFMEGASSVRLLSATAAASLRPEAQRQAEALFADPHTHFGLGFEDAGPRLVFRDVRKFGKLQLLAAGEPCPRLDKLGVDALEAGGEAFHATARHRQTPIKTLLLDQSVLAGVGNIYADEALFVARIRPTRAARRVSKPRCVALIEAAKKVMLRSIETGGSSISDYIQPDGQDGHYQDERQVYARTGEACKRCGGTIRRVVVGGRGSHFCPGCQS